MPKWNQSDRGVGAGGARSAYAPLYVFGEKTNLKSIWICFFTWLLLSKALCIPQYSRTSHRPWSIPSHTIRTELWRPWTVMLTDFDSSLNKDLLPIRKMQKILFCALHTKLLEKHFLVYFETDYFLCTMHSSKNIVCCSPKSPKIQNYIIISHNWLWHDQRLKQTM